MGAVSAVQYRKWRRGLKKRFLDALLAAVIVALSSGTLAVILRMRGHLESRISLDLRDEVGLWSRGAEPARADASQDLGEQGQK